MAFVLKWVKQLGQFSHGKIESESPNRRKRLNRDSTTENGGAMSSMLINQAASGTPRMPERGGERSAGRSFKVAKNSAGDVVRNLRFAKQQKLVPPAAPMTPAGTMRTDAKRRLRTAQYDATARGVARKGPRPFASGQEQQPTPYTPESRRMSFGGGMRGGVGPPWKSARGGGMGVGVPSRPVFGTPSPCRVITANLREARAAPPLAGRRYDGVDYRRELLSERKNKSTWPIIPLKTPSPHRSGEGEGGGGAAVVGREEEGGDLRRSVSSRETTARKGLFILRSRAMAVLEKRAYDLEWRDPEVANFLRTEARDIGNWAKEAEEARREKLEKDILKDKERVERESMAMAAEAVAAAKAETLAAHLAFLSDLKREKEEQAQRAEEEEQAIKLAAAAAEAEEEKAKMLAEREAVGLTSEQREKVRRAWSSSGSSQDGEVVVKAFNDVVTKGSMCTLKDGNWLGDEVLNIYMKSLQARNRDSVASGKRVPRCGIMNSFFFTQLSDSGRGYRYQGVKRFLRKAQVDLFNLDKFIFPVNVNQNHWTLAVINFRLERLEYYDSLGSPFGDTGFEFMARFVDDESKSKRGGQAMDISHWPRFNYRNLPRQQNGIDCGVFASMFADRLSKGRPLSFSQADIAHYREVMTLAILRGERVPTDEEAFVEDGGGDSQMHEWWELPEDGHHEQDPLGVMQDMEGEGCDEPEGTKRDAGGWPGPDSIQPLQGRAHPRWQQQQQQQQQEQQRQGQQRQQQQRQGQHQQQALTEWARPSLNGTEHQSTMSPDGANCPRNPFVIPEDRRGYSGWRVPHGRDEGEAWIHAKTVLEQSVETMDDDL